VVCKILRLAAQNHCQGRARDDFVHRFADDHLAAQPSDLQKGRVHRNEAKSTFGLDRQVENDIPDGVVELGVNGDQTVPPDMWLPETDRPEIRQAPSFRYNAVLHHDPPTPLTRREIASGKDGTSG
jgi:hypothetical protein